MKIRGIGRVTLLTSKKIASNRKQAFEKRAEKYIKEISSLQKKYSEYELISFSGAGSFLDQLKCIFSFIMNVGVPVKWYIYNDDSYTEEQIKKLHELPFVEVRKWDYVYHNEFNITTYNWTHKKLNAIINHDYKFPSIYCDSDVLFFPSAFRFLNLPINNNYVVAEHPEAYSLDSDIRPEDFNSIYIYNSGFFILNQLPDFSPAINYMNKKGKSDLTHFSEQTAFNVMVYAQKKIFETLDPRRFIVSAEDQFSFFDFCDYKKVAIRHFVGPIRHKLWINNSIG